MMNPKIEVDDMERGTWCLFDGAGKLLTNTTAGHKAIIKMAKNYRKNTGYSGTLTIRRPKRGD